MSANDLQALLRFLSQDAKVSLATAMGKVKDLQKSNLDSPEKLAKAKPEALKNIFDDEKVAKQVIAAAKRVSKKRAAGDDANPTPKKKRNESLFSDEPLSPAQLEESLRLPHSDLDESDLANTILFTNRAPLVLAFLVILLKYTMPEQPLSSRLSLAQGYVSITSRSRAVYLGIENGLSAEEEGFGEGQPVVNVAGKDIKVLRRWGYDWTHDTTESGTNDKVQHGEPEEDSEEKPALWALDLEALKKAGTDKQPAATTFQTHSNIPIYTPQSARAYLLRAFDDPPSDAARSKKQTAAAKASLKEKNLGKLLRALDLLYESWAAKLSPDELDKRTWSWYVKVRPSVADGAAGWGGKNELRLADILHLRPNS